MLWQLMLKDEEQVYEDDGKATGGNYCIKPETNIVVSIILLVFHASYNALKFGHIYSSTAENNKSSNNEAQLVLNSSVYETEVRCEVAFAVITCFKCLTYFLTNLQRINNYVNSNSYIFEIFWKYSLIDCNK